MKSDLITPRFISHYVLFSIGHTLSLVPLLRLLARGVPVSTVYGSKDKVTPAHQGSFLWELARVPYHVIYGAGHMPYMLAGGEYFAEVRFTELTSALFSYA